MRDKKIAAFFDFDGTLYDGVIAFDFLNFCIRHKVLRLNEMARLPKFLYYYALDKFKIADRYDVNVKIYRKIKGWDKKLFEAKSKEFFKTKIARRLIPGVVNILNDHKENQHWVVIVTTALHDIVNPVTHRLNVDDIIATEVEYNNGICTGVIKALPAGRMRIKIINDYCMVNNIDLAKCYAYSDHYSDIPLLKSVGNPVATNPERKLRKYAKRQGWSIIDY